MKSADLISQKRHQIDQEIEKRLRDSKHYTRKTINQSSNNNGNVNGHTLNNPNANANIDNIDITSPNFSKYIK
jgi:hypothetical protein